MKKVWLIHILLAILLLVSLTLPLFKEKTTDLALAEESIEDISKKWAEGTWEFLTDAVENIKNKLIEEKVVEPLSSYEQFKKILLTGYGYGISPLGGTEKLLLNIRHKIFDPISVLSGLMVLMTIIQLASLSYFSRLKNPILGFVNILILLSLFGITISDEKYSVLLYGSLLFIGIQMTYMILIKYRTNK